MTPYLHRIFSTLHNQFYSYQGLSAMRRSFNCSVNFFALEIGSASGYVPERSASVLYELHKLTHQRNPPLQNFIHNVSQLAKLGSYRIFKGRHDKSRNGNIPYLYPDIGGRVFSTTRRNILNKYVYPLARAGGCIVAIIFIIFLLYLLCLTLLWIWSLLSRQLLVFVFLGLVFLCLLVFRPWEMLLFNFSVLLNHVLSLYSIGNKPYFSFSKTHNFYLPLIHYPYITSRLRINKTLCMNATILKHKSALKLSNLETSSNFWLKYGIFT